MKKQYIAPVLKVATIELQGLIAASNVIKPTISDQVTEDDAKMSNQFNNDWKHSWD